MAAATAAALVPSGLASSSLNGTKLRIKPTAQVSMRRSTAKLGVSAKYGEKSVYFDLGDINNTTGAWDLYGSDTPSPYNGLQSQFFQIFAGAFTKRGLLLKFLLLAGTGAVAFTGANAPASLVPVKRGAVGPPTPGPRGKI
ncbi:hypothetical protein SELMODRAFT_227307 [Selaginella moellendorffii]|uniref:Photosystem I reaction center subunit VI, chloroplastic n=1 Tax=Selaginella moellendorffii TaxID=88036 RepID=D8QU91_SELML|nr:photosystem I reaction center subunit VI, chloroplastic [Selaginella moellendorffii]EFJ35825.1 hypothetical protein SELMODRAFT_227307 [Selaginella moellendorffii]|eukprot:XP_002962362.1 photosystem I reaction center subunit VI, chloroplastic [Selaginella moellendorffii]